MKTFFERENFCFKFKILIILKKKTLFNIVNDAEIIRNFNM